VKDYAQAAIDVLRVLRGENFAIAFVELRMQFHRRYSKGFICSTSHGIAFFEHVLAGANAWTEKGDLEDNFRKILKQK